jgi:hypothetical protein
MRQITLKTPALRLCTRSAHNTYAIYSHGAIAKQVK